MGADHAETACDSRAAAADIDLSGDIVEIDPVALSAGDNAFGAQDRAVTRFIGERVQDPAQLVLAEAAGRFDAPASEDLIRVMMVMAVLMIVVVMAALVVVIVVIMVVMMVLVLFVLIVMVVMMVLVLLILIIVMVVMAALVLVILIVMMVVMVFVLLPERLHLGTQSVFLHGLADLAAVQLAPGRGDQAGLRVQGLQ